MDFLRTEATTAVEEDLNNQMDEGPELKDRTSNVNIKTSTTIMKRLYKLKFYMLATVSQNRPHK